MAGKTASHQNNEENRWLKTNMGAGHFGLSGRYEYLKEIAFEFAFVIDTLQNRMRG